MDHILQQGLGKGIKVDDSTEGDVIVKRTKGNIVVELSLRAEQIPKFESELEDLCNKYLNMKDE